MGQCYNSTVVNASAEEVWSDLKKFHDWSWAANVLPKVEAIGDKPGHEVGARRKLNDAILETLIELNDEERTIAYTIDDGPEPMSADSMERYVGRAKVFPVTSTGTAFVVWTAEYTTKDDEAVREFCDPIYQALLTELASKFA